MNPQQENIHSKKECLDLRGVKETNRSDESMTGLTGCAEPIPKSAHFINTQQLKEANLNSIPVEDLNPPKKPLCLFCRKELLPTSSGRKRRYCNKKCGTKYWIQQNKEKFNSSCRIASREYQRRKQKEKNEARNKKEDILRAKMEKDNLEKVKGGVENDK